MNEMEQLLYQKQHTMPHLWYNKRISTDGERRWLSFLFFVGCESAPKTPDWPLWGGSGWTVFAVGRWPISDPLCPA